MSVQVVLRAIAQAEADEAARWYERKQHGLGAGFLVELQRLLDLIAGQPDRFPVAIDDTREAPLVRFPYCVYYRIRPARVVVTAVFHTARDPAVWQGRS